MEYVTFPNEGHGFARKESQIKADQAILGFLDQYLAGTPPAAAPTRGHGR